MSEDTEFGLLESTFSYLAASASALTLFPPQGQFPQWIMFAFYAPTLILMANPNDRHRAYMSFIDRQGWQCQFLEADLQTPLPKRLHFASADKVAELVERAGGFTDQETRPMVNQGIFKVQGRLDERLTSWVVWPRPS
jgi:hypothetical protein